MQPQKRNAPVSSVYDFIGWIRRLEMADEREEKAL